MKWPFVTESAGYATEFRNEGVHLMQYLVLLAALLFLYCGGDLRAQSAPAKTPAVPARIVLLVDEIKAIRNFPVVIAERLGYLKGDGVIVTVMNIRDDVPTADMLLDGRRDAVLAYYHRTSVHPAEGKAFRAIV